MKIITNDAAYVQKKDLLYLNNSDLEIPMSIFLKIVGNSVKIVDKRNQNDFIKYEAPHEIEFFKKIDWIVDYYEINDLNENEIIELYNQHNKEIKLIVNTYNSMTEKEKIKNKNMVQRFEILKFKMISIRDILWFKQGHIDIILPDNLECKNKICTNKCNIKK